MDKRIDKDLDSKVKKTSEKISENMHIIANDPSLAFYRIQEHVRKILPLIVDRTDVHDLQQDLQGHCYDLEYSLSAIKGVCNSRGTFNNIHEALKNAIFLKQQLNYEEQRRNTSKRESNNNNNNSMYKRLSSHIPDLPEIISSRVESMVRTTAATATHTNSSQSSTATANATELQKSNTSMY